ncbi:MAG: DNA-directed RNA polymerase subunit beta' [Planctomycetota bacterium]|nr:DNA-directed RNA polymerase subunit beta' [Planctomycetota bacterium]
MAQGLDNINEYKGISIRLASPNDIRDWSFGEVKRAETINYRTYKAEKEGLFCQKIFGPEKDYECFCGKYKGIRYKNIICDRCGVKVTSASVRRQRMGHINLAEPVVHIWFFRNIPSRLGHLLQLTTRKLQAVIYYQRFIVIDPGETDLEEKQVLNEEEYFEYKKKYGDKFKAGIGARAIRDLLRKIDLEELTFQLRDDLKKTRAKTKKKKLVKRIEIAEALLNSNNKPEWMVQDVIPIIPPDLRPLVPLDSGTFATSDLNDLYRRVISRNNRLKKLFELNAPSVIVRNEMRMLQQAVDALYDNSSLRRPVQGSSGRPLKSLSDMISGKQGRFRENLLGKRVDYSARSVIVVGPHLKLHQCGLPKKIALELFQPYIINKLRERGLADTLKNAKRIIERRDDEVWDILEEVTKEHPVLLNRAPTLHRMGIQAFMPVLIEGEAIQLHPMVCKGYNADFDGDQMAVHLPLSIEAQLEAEFMMLSTENILSPASGKPVIAADQDIVLGSYFLTWMEEEKEKIEDSKFKFADFNEALYAYETGQVSLYEPIKVRLGKKRRVIGPKKRRQRTKDGLYVTCIGRLILNDILPEGLPFYNFTLEKGGIRRIIDDCYRMKGRTPTLYLIDKVKWLGFHYATLSGMSFAVSNLKVPEKKQELIAEAEKKIEALKRSWRRGMITATQRSNMTVDIWNETVEKVTAELEKILKTVTTEDGKPFLNPVFVMANSGARGSMSQVRQLAGMRGLMAKPSGEIIETPIRASFSEGLKVFEYFSSTHGARKGLADTALKTADSGYLTRRLVEVAQDVVVTTEDCMTRNGITKEAVFQGEEKVVSLSDNIIGRVARDNIVDPVTDAVVVGENQLITLDIAEQLEEMNIQRIRVRSPLTCDAPHGICAKCYGADLSMGHSVELGTSVGTIAAQSIGEPGTQLTMRTFHIGGTASVAKRDTLVRARRSATVKFEGLETVPLTPENADQLKTSFEEHDKSIVVNRRGALLLLDDRGREMERYSVPQSSHIKVEDEQKVKVRQPLFSRVVHITPILSERDGAAKFVDLIDEETVSVEKDPRTGQASLKVIEHRGERQPQLEIIQVVRTKESGFLVNINAKIEEHGGDRYVEEAGKVAIMTARGKEVERVTVPSGYRLSVKEGDTPKNSGEIKNIVSEMDDLAADERIKKMLKMEPHECGIIAYQPIAPYNLPEKSVVSVQPFEEVLRGMEIAKIPREMAGTQDITGGLPRVQELFEARTPKDKAEIAEVSGTVEVGELKNKKREIIIRADGGSHLDRTYRVPQGRRLLIQTGDHVEAGDSLTEGPLDPKDLLRVSGPERLQRYLLEEIQNVYRAQNVGINDKHVEIIIRQMFNKVEVTDAGDTELLPKQEVPRGQIVKINEKATSDGRYPATFTPKLKGIMKQGVQAESFLSAASFQETSKVLTDAALSGKFDPLIGLKENVIVGRIIPAGTGFEKVLYGEVEHHGEPIEEETEEEGEESPLSA